jgi:hypothetical protein
VAKLLSWFKRVLQGEMQRSAQFDVQVDERVVQQLQRLAVGGRRASASAPFPRETAPSATSSSATAAASGLVYVRAREPIPPDYLSKQQPQYREHLLQVFAYRDHLQKLLDGNWTVLSNEEIYVRALEGYRWLELLEHEIAKEPGRFCPRFDEAREILERFFQHARQHRPLDTRNGV